jgi:GNAT superfamily N-acetyltransferase
VTYRLATMADLETVIVMLRSYLREQQMGGSPVLFTRQTLDVYRDMARCYLSGLMEGLVVLAEDEGEVVGFALSGEEMAPPALETDLGRMAQVWLVWVDPTYRKTGAALGMLSWGRPHLLERGFERACMCIRKGNDLGEKLTLSYGARPVERMYHFDLQKEPRHGQPE